MARSARRPEPLPRPGNPMIEAAATIGTLVSRNPALVGGSTAFLIALSFVSANAVWYQPHAHQDAFFATRDVDRRGAEVAFGETTIRIERPGPAPRRIEGDPVTKNVQAVLKELNLYDGTVDGLTGPSTRKAVEAYQKTVGLPITGAIDGELLKQLDVNPTAAIGPRTPDGAAQPTPRAEAIDEAPSPARFEGADSSATARIKKIQGGLRAFGNKDVEIDGVLGARTRSAVSEFQSLFGLKPTGEADEAVYAKMKETGFIN